MDSLEARSLKGNSSRAFLTNGEHMTMGTSTYFKIFSFYYLHSFLLFFWIFMICPFPPCVFEFSQSVPSKNIFMGTWEHRNIMGSPRMHNSLGIFCWERSLKIQREIKRKVFMFFENYKTHCWMSGFWFECGLPSLFEHKIRSSLKQWALPKQRLVWSGAKTHAQFKANHYRRFY